MNRCGDCRFWGRHVQVYPGSVEWEDQTGEWRQCGRLRMEDSYALEETRHELAVTQDGSGYFAVLKCRADFGCVLFEPLPKEATNERSE